MTLSLKGLESVVTGIGVTAFVFTLSSILLYLFRPERGLSNCISQSIWLSNSSKNECLKKKKKIKKKFGKMVSNTRLIEDEVIPGSSTETMFTQHYKKSLVGIIEKEKEVVTLSNLAPFLKNDNCINSEQPNHKLDFQTTELKATNSHYSSEFASIVSVPISRQPEYKNSHNSKSKKRNQKKTENLNEMSHNKPCLTSANNLINAYKGAQNDADQILKPVLIEKCYTNLSALTDMQTKVKNLEKLLKQTKIDLEVSRQAVAKLKTDSAKSKSQTDELQHLLQQQKSKLVDVNITNANLSKEKHILETKLKSLDENFCTLRSHLNLANNEIMSHKNLSEKQISEMNATNTKMSVLLAASNQATQSTSQELIRTQELVTVTSNENKILKARINRLTSECQQMHADLQNMRNRHDSLSVTNQVIWEDKRSKVQTSINELSHRVVQLEAQLQHRTAELDSANQRNKEFMSALSALKVELEHHVEQDRKQNNVISSLKYQFLELNAEKQQLSDRMLISKVNLEHNVCELRARVASLSKDLADSLKANAAHNNRVDSKNSSMNSPQLSDDNSPACSPEVSSTSAIVLDCPPETNTSVEQLSIAEENEQLRLKLAALEVEYANSKVEATEAREQHALLQTTLMHTESVLAKLQRTIEDEETKWQRLLLSSKNENINLKSNLETLTNECAMLKKNLHNHLVEVNANGHDVLGLQFKKRFSLENLDLSVGSLTEALWNSGEIADMSDMKRQSLDVSSTAHIT